MSDGQSLVTAPGGSLFREQALERLKSPEQLDHRINLIPPGMRLMLVSASVIIAAALVWAVFGSVPERALGQGVLLGDRTGNFAVATVSSGLVLDVVAKPGDHVEAGAEIANIEQRLLSAEIQNAIAEVARLEANLAKLKAANAIQIGHSEEMTKRQMAAVDGQMAANTVRRDRLGKLVEGYESLRSKGMMAQAEVIARQEQYDQTNLDLANGSAKKVEIEAALQKQRDDLADVERQKQEEIDLRKSQLEELRVKMGVGSVVRAPIGGVIQEVHVGRGDVATSGQVIATIGPAQAENAGADEMLVLLAGPRRKRVAVGMEARVVPDGTKREEYGSMRGRVTYVSPSEVSNAHIEQILHNAQLTQRLIGDGSALLAHVELVRSKTNPSGFAWWSGSGPPYRITPGSVASLDIIIGQVRPISLVLPFLRKLLSVDG
ncbi:MAG TPA: NHLP bacteriocin system secretion protein [Propionibacteriaceae bacterium]|nr:NHLP bacteriocin system secretion protein [Propionibacteriaceae bacterium]